MNTTIADKAQRTAAKKVMSDALSSHLLALDVRALKPNSHQIIRRGAAVFNFAGETTQRNGYVEMRLDGWEYIGYVVNGKLGLPTGIKRA